jgi:hypothetical protein
VSCPICFVFERIYNISNEIWLDVFFLILFAFVHTSYSGLKEPHQFSENECQVCHIDIYNNPASLKPMSSFVCEYCHAGTKQELSHPVDISPRISVPTDMPLEQGKLSCGPDARRAWGLLLGLINFSGRWNKNFDLFL